MAESSDYRIALSALYRRIDERVRPLAAEEVALADAWQRVLAAAVTAPTALPAFDRSLMDGFALYSGDVADSERSLPLTAAAIMGTATPSHVAGTARPITTGAMLPAGADTVVKWEDAVREGDRVTLPGPLAAEDNVERTGSQVEAGALLYPAGQQIGPIEMSLLATCGIDRLPVHRRPRVTVLNSGDELAPVDQEPLAPGKIRASNGLVLSAMIAAYGGECCCVERVGDDETIYRHRLERALANSDLVVMTGGSAHGPRDISRRLLMTARPALTWLADGVALPACGYCLAALCGEKGLLVLPGRPGAAMVSFRLVGHYLLRRLAGLPGADPAATVQAILSEDCPFNLGEAAVIPVALARQGDHWRATPQPAPSSTRSMSPHGLIVCEGSKKPLAAGEEAEVWLWGV